MQQDRFTIKSQEAFAAAQRLADERRNPQTTPEHLLAEADGTARAQFARLQQLRRQLAALMMQGPGRQPAERARTE